MTDASPAPDRGWVLYAVSWPLFGACVIVTALRLWVRTRIIRSLGWDDAFNVLALICATINTTMIAVSIIHGTGRHADDLSDDQKLIAMKYQLLSQGFHVMATNWGKVSVALFLVRIISKAKQQKTVMYAGMVGLTIINALGVYTIYGQCTPTAKIWDANIEGSCWESHAQRNYAFFQGTVSAVTDLILAIYPLFTIWGLQMPTKVKFGIGFVLSLGIIAMIAAIVKTIHLAALSSRVDYTWDLVDLTIWVAVEQYLIILAACIPALTPLFNIVVRQRSTKRNTGSNNIQKVVATHSRHSSRPQPYSPFASVGREYVEYPMTWARSDRGNSGSDSEEPIISPAEANRGILMTTEFRLSGHHKAEP